MPWDCPGGRGPTSQRYLCTKVLLAKDQHTPFTEHCRNYENTYRTLQTDIQSLKDQVQELHRDLTKHHSVINTDSMRQVLDRCADIDRQIDAQYTTVETMRTVFEEIWEETLQRVANEQEIYEAQLHDLLQLKQENSYLTTIARQIGPYIISIAKVKDRLAPRFQEPKVHNDDRTEMMLKIYEDSHMKKEKLDRDDQTCDTCHDWDKSSSEITSNNSIVTVDYHWPGKHRDHTQAANHKKMPS